jgi:hypothetical protein
MPPVKQQRAVPMNIDMRVSLWRIYLATGTAAVTAYFLVPDNWWQTGTGVPPSASPPWPAYWSGSGCIGQAAPACG